MKPLLSTSNYIIDMELECPAWLDACYVQKVLQKADNDASIEVSNISVQPATAKGENYLSDVYRITVEVSGVQGDQRNQEERSLILKLVPKNEFLRKLISENGFFATELSMMSDTLPRMSEILGNFSKTKLSARCLYIHYEKPTHVFVEDLAPAGFRMPVRQEGLDLDHCLLALRNLGLFHASSVALGEQNRENFSIHMRMISHCVDIGLTCRVNYDRILIFGSYLLIYRIEGSYSTDKVQTGLLHKDNPGISRTFIIMCMKSLAEESAKWPELNPRIAEKLLKLSECVYEKGCETTSMSGDDFKVLNHGDFSIRNMMFRYVGERRKPMDQILVDFQLSHHGSPAEDLLHFLATSPSDDIRHHNREQLLREYHTSLASTMAKLKCKTKVPSFDALLETCRRRGLYEVIASSVILPAVVLEKGDIVEYKEFSEDDGAYDNPAYRGKTYRKIMTRMLPVYDSMGLLDV